MHSKMRVEVRKPDGISTTHFQHPHSLGLDVFQDFRESQVIPDINPIAQGCVGGVDRGGKIGGVPHRRPIVFSGAIVYLVHVTKIKMGNRIIDSPSKYVIKDLSFPGYSTMKRPVLRSPLTSTMMKCIPLELFDISCSIMFGPSETW